MKTVFWVLGMGLGLYGLICLLMYRFQEALIFPGYQLPADFVFEFPFSPEPEEIWLEAPDGRIHALYFQPSQPQGVVLYFHGNGGALDDWGTVAPRFLEEQLAVFIIDFRGYGKSVGERSEAAMLADAELAFAYVAEKWPIETIRVYGRSLGTGMASYLAARHPVKSLLLETPYTALSEVAQARYRWLPVVQLIRFHFPSKIYLKSVQCPVYLIHGTSDRVIPVSHSRRLKELFPAARFLYEEIPGGNHRNLDTYPAYGRWLKEGLQVAE
jgi:hypothetical protein